MTSQTPTLPLRKTPTSVKAMSSSLKERLRKLGRYHGSPSNTSMSTLSPSASNMSLIEDTRTPVLDSSRMTQKRTNLTLKIKRKFTDDEEEEEKGKTEGKDREEEENKRSCKRRLVQMEKVDSGTIRETDVDRDLILIREQIKERKETLRKLKLVKVYRTKNDLNVLEDMITKWREVFVEALKELRNKSTMEPKPTLGQLLDHLQIDHELVRYDKEGDSFN